MKRIPLIYMLIFVSLISFSGLAQTDQVNVSVYTYRPERSKSKIDEPYKIFKFNDTLYSFFYKSGSLNNSEEDDPELFGRLSNKFKIEKLGITEPDGDYEIEFVAPLGKHVWYFATQWDEKAKMLTLLNWVLNTETLAIEGQPQLVLTIDESRYNFYADPKFQFYYSPDSSKMLISYHLIRNFASVGFGFAVVNKEGKLDWYSPDNLRFKREGEFLIDDFQVNNKGEVFLVTKNFGYRDIFPKRKSTEFSMERQSHPDYILTIVKIVNQGKKVIYYEPELSGMYIQHLKMGIRNDDQMVCAGLYCIPGTFSVIGVCSCLPDKDNENKMVVQSFDFDFEYIIQDINEDRKKVEQCFKNKLEFETFGYLSTPLIFRQDGSFWFVTEQYQDPHIKKMQTEYFWNKRSNVNVLSFSADGKLEWKNKLVKMQKAREEELSYTGIYVFVRKDNLHILYNNLPSSNFNVKNDETSAMMATFDRNGIQSNQELFSFEEKNLILVPGSTIKFSDNRFVIYGYNVHISDSFVELTF